MPRTTCIRSPVRASIWFADARKLVEVLGDRSKFSRAGDLAVLRHYERARREAALAVGQVTDRLRSLYLSEWSLRAGCEMTACEW
jgi:2-polyprenyl-6-methoxyphenol hydroxylase-like FAD-dependent oxidoreductase